MRHGQAQARRGQQQQVRRGAGSSSRSGAARRGQQEWCSTAMHLRFYFTFVLVSSILYALIFDTVLSNKK